MVIQSRSISQEDIKQIRDMIISNPGWNRTRVSKELCRRWEWFNHLGHIKDMACRTLLLKLEGQGYLTLPVRQGPSSPNTYRNHAIQDVFHETRLIEGSLRELMPLAIELVQDEGLFSLFRCLLSRYHYLGYGGSVGENMKYLVFDRRGRPLSCVLFGSAAWKVACRDNYIGWERGGRESRLGLVTNNMRFLILPWVRVPHLASHVLGRIARRIRKDWVSRYGHEVILLESFVEVSRFRGTCYRAANWVYVGRTKGRSRNDRHHSIGVPAKEVFLYPLRSRFREILVHG
jgi:Druantia protein DruA